MLTSDNWKDYMLIDASDGQKLEKWGDYYLVRPDPQAIWQCRTEKNYGHPPMPYTTGANRAAERGSIAHDFQKAGRLNTKTLYLM